MEHAMTGRLWSRYWSFVPLLAALLAGTWLLSTRFLSGYLVDSLWEVRYALFTLLAPPVFIWAAVLSAVHLLRPPAFGLPAALPLAVCLLAGGLYVAPMPVVQDMDFQRHYAMRMEVVQRIEAGGLWNGSPLFTAVSLPWPDYPVSVSNGAGQRSVAVYREEGVLNVGFYSVTGGLLDRGSMLLYRADGQPPLVPNRVLPNAASSERVDDHWHRVTFATKELDYVAWALLIVVLTAATGVVLVPLALLLHHLAHRGEVAPQ